MAVGLTSRRGPRSRAAAVSILSNSVLILLKLVAGAITGSVAIVTEAIHSGIDLIASLVAYFSVRQAEEPPDRSHRYGHEKFENVAAGVEGMLILVGSAIIVYAAVRRLVTGGELESIGVGIAIVAFTAVANLVVSTWLFAQAREHQSPALNADAAHLRSDAWTSFGVIGGLALVSWTDAEWIDPAVALVIAVAIIVTGVRLLSGSWRELVDESLPPEDIDAIRSAIVALGPEGIAGYHALRTRRAGPRRYVDVHVQFRAGTSLERAHELAHRLQDDIRERLTGADVLIHLEPEDNVRPGTEVRISAG